MNKSQLIAIIAALLIIVACFMPWVQLPNGNIISGVDTTGTRFGKPAYGHFILTAIVVLLTFLPYITAKRFNVFFGALNLAWAVKNFLIISRCEGGECPQKQTGFYLLLIASILLMFAVLFPKVDAQQINSTKPDGLTV